MEGLIRENTGKHVGKRYQITGWQKYWLYFLIAYSFLHLIRDFLQDSGVKIFLSTVLVKKASNPVLSSILWSSLNTYFIAVVEIVLAIYCLRKKQFGKVGLSTIIIAAITVMAWLLYWLFL